jgi:ComF family protein
MPLSLALHDSLPGLLRQTIRFLLPMDCEACGTSLTDDPIPHFCADCWHSIRTLPDSRCTHCDRPFASPVATLYSPNHVCHTCHEELPAYNRAWTLYPYLPPLQDAIWLFKYRGKVALADALAQLMIDRLPSFDPVDLLMPVPLHRQRLREREFNQSLLLADRIGQYLKTPVSCDNLIRTVPSPAQTTLSRADRLKNLRGAFALRHPESIAGRRILLLDDVFTTGSTVNECAKTLRKAGSGAVFVLTLGRTVEHGMVPDRILAQRAHPPVGLLGG